MIEDRLRDWAAARGYGIAVAGPAIVDVVKRKLEDRRAGGMLDPAFFAGNLSSFRFLEGISIQGPVSVVMVAVPVPIHTVRVTAGGRTIEALIPPTYVRYRATFNEVLADMKTAALPEKAAAEALKAPLKSLAVHMGLVVYGRNNITYRPGLGTGHQLCGYAVGVDPRSSGAAAASAGLESMLERCGDCRACLNACPTGAIREDRFLISAERCYTLLSESPKPFPAWARRPASVCLIGCMACQQACPENKERLMRMPSGVELDGDETEALIEVGRTLDRPPVIPAVEAGEDLKSSAAWRSVRDKFERLGMSEDAEVMGRNLAHFLGRGRPLSCRRRSSRRP